jgi:hypothetical protein
MAKNSDNTAIENKDGFFQVQKGCLQFTFINI